MGIKTSNVAINSTIKELYKLNLGGNLNIDGSLYINETLLQPIDKIEKGAIDGVATLDGGGKVPNSQLAASIMDYKGHWDASDNIPLVTDGSGNTGDVFLVSVAGAQEFDSVDVSFGLGDWNIYNGAIWEKSVNTNAVVSVNGKTGPVVLTTTDVSEGNQQYYTETRVSENTDVSANTDKRHDAVTITELNGLRLSGQALSINLASIDASGALSKTDWNTFNDKLDFVEVTDISAGTRANDAYLKGDGTWSTITLSGDSSSFLSLHDTPGNYTDASGKVVIGNSAENGLVFGDTQELYVEVADISANGTAGILTYLRGDGEWADGVQGVPGVDGVDGADGAKGDTGDTGPQGIPGVDGADGAKGDTGDTGIQGVPGVDGVDGADGAKGDTGDTGPQGIPGVDGADGAKGDTGDTGLQGIPGVDGADGADGAKGDTGDTGPQGIQGEIGPEGPAGPGVDTSSFISLNDTPGDYTGFDGSIVKVSGNQLVFDVLASGGGSSFVSLSDTPSTMTGKAGYALKVNTLGTLLEFVPTEQLKVIVPDDISALGTPDSSSYLRGDGSWATIVSGGGSSLPGGDDGQLQFNDNGDLGGADMYYNTSTESYLLGLAVPNVASKLNFNLDASGIDNIFSLTTTRNKGDYEYVGYPYSPPYQWGADSTANYFKFTDIYDNIETELVSFYPLDMANENIDGVTDVGYMLTMDFLEANTGIHIGPVPSVAGTTYPYLHLEKKTKGGYLVNTILENCYVDNNITNYHAGTKFSTPLYYINASGTAPGTLVRGPSETYLVDLSTDAIEYIYPWREPNRRYQAVQANLTVNIDDLVSGDKGTITLTKSTSTVTTVTIVDFSNSKPTQIVKNSPTSYDVINPTSGTTSIIKYYYDGEVLYTEYYQ